MTTLISQTALVYVNHGRWVVECPREFCANAFTVSARQSIFECKGNGSCGMVATITWPANSDDLWEALMQRPVPATRNWFPVGHELAVRFSLPMGQSPKDLIDEQKEMEHGALS